MPTRRQLIQKITLNANTSSVTFSGIPQNYTYLRLVISARSARESSNSDGLQLSFNGSTSNYSKRSFYADSNTAGSASVSNRIFNDIPAANVTASTFGSVHLHIPNYAGATNKSYSATGAWENNSSTVYGISAQVGLWSDTSAITSLALTTSNNQNFIAGSTFYLYGITHVPIINGGEVSIRGGFKYHTFRSTSTLQVVEPGDVEYLVVAGGGGGGGNFYGGGGGAGGALSGRTAITVGTRTITVGAGGASSSSQAYGGDGTTSSIGTIVSTTGGGSGGYWFVVGNPGGSGGGGGGGGGGAGTFTGGSGISGQGFAGGTGFNISQRGAGAGGGGASAVGGNGTQDVGGTGGAGIQWPANSNNYYSGGGGGGSYQFSSTANAGGIGGGGRGSSGANDNPATSGIANTGGGGGGWSADGAGTSSGTGGSGIVVIRYPYDGN